MPQTGKIPVSAPVRTADDHDRHACIRSSHTPALSISSIALNRTDPLHPKVWARFECAGSCMPRHAPHAGWETYCLAHSPTFAQMYARTCISRQMLDGAFVMQLHPPDYADHDIRNAPNAMALCQCSAHSAGLCMPRHTEQTGHQTPAQSRAAPPHTQYSITETPHPAEISFRCSGYGALDTADGRHLTHSTAATVTVHFRRRRRR